MSLGLGIHKEISNRAATAGALALLAALALGCSSDGDDGASTGGAAGTGGSSGGAGSGGTSGGAGTGGTSGSAGTGGSSGGGAFEYAPCAVDQRVGGFGVQVTPPKGN